MRAFVTLSGVKYGYDTRLFLIIQEKEGKRTIPCTFTDMGQCWLKLFALAYEKGIYMIDTSEDDTEGSTDRLIRNRNSAFVGEGIYDLETEQPIFLMWWTSFKYQGEVVKLASIYELLGSYSESELVDIFKKLALVADIEINGKFGFGGCEQLNIEGDNSRETNYTPDLPMLHYQEEAKPYPGRN